MNVDKRLKITAKLKSWDVLGNKAIDDINPQYYLDGGWRQKDLDVLYKDNLRLKRYLDKSKIPFNLYFTAYKDEAQIRRIEKFEEGPVKYKYAKIVIPDLPAKDDSAINIILRGMGNLVGKEGNLPPTPWIAVHWIAHGIMKSRGLDNKIYGKLEDVLVDMVDLDDSGYIHKREQSKIDFMHDVFTFRAARKDKIRNMYEGWHDLMAQYIITGKIKLNNRQAEIWGTDVEQFTQHVEHVFKKAIKKAIGRYFIV